MKATRNAAALGGKYLGLLGVVLLVGAPLAGADHDGNTCPNADPATYLTIATGLDLDADGVPDTYYLEERNGGLPPVPLTGFLIGNGSWTWKESGDLPGLQTGPADGILNDWFPPGCNEEWDMGDPTNGYPCLLIDIDPIGEGACSHGDELVQI